MRRGRAQDDETGVDARMHSQSPHLVIYCNNGHPFAILVQQRISRIWYETGRLPGWEGGPWHFGGVGSEPDVHAQIDGEVGHVDALRALLHVFDLELRLVHAVAHAGGERDARLRS